MSIYEKRWGIACDLTNTVQTYVHNPDCVVYFKDTVIAPGCLITTQDDIFVQDDNVKYIVYVRSSDYDEGAHWSEQQIIEYFQESFTVLRKVKVEWL